MKYLSLLVIVTLSTLTSLVDNAPANAAINRDRELDAIIQLTTVETETTPEIEPIQIDLETEIDYSF